MTSHFHSDSGSFWDGNLCFVFVGQSERKEQQHVSFRCPEFMNTLTFHTLTLCLLPAVEATIVFGHLDRTTCVFNTGGSPHCLLMQSKRREAAVTRCSLSLTQERVCWCSVLWSYWKPVRQTGTMKTLPAASSSCPWCSESKLSSTVWPLLLWCMMGLFSRTLKTVSVPVHPANEWTNVH